MTIQDQLREALAAFMRAAVARDQQQVGATLKRLMELERKLGADAPAMLRHYLENRSYQKALNFLNTGRAESETPQRNS